ncbi:MFS transporter [Flavobacterium sp. '19STA2R22 D10 B1']|uniref:MFS transporter n=1 Tax=Flavobacterium aerium TaxID=3037261 RepID=UPI00278BF4E3|nr:MFS transporter [Flavobacterium sp. '19STA2R22 D10 B1']
MEEIENVQEIPTVLKETKTTEVKTIYSKNRVRWAVSFFFFGQGLCFATWASRIPDLKTALHLSEGDLGTILFALPLGQLIIMPVSGRIVAKLGSHRVLVAALSLYALSLTNLGLATQPWHLGLSLMLFGLFSNLSNIAVNTQGVYAEEIFGRPIMSSFHGVWSIAGFTGAIIGLGMMYFHQSPYQHFWVVTIIILITILFNYKFLTKVVVPAEPQKKKLFSKPDAMLLQLGVIGFCSMASEGAMFDWSGVYFKDVVMAPGALVTLGYASFMIMMASGRFVGDKLIVAIGRKRLMQFGGILISTGLFISVFFPYIIPATIAFMLVGLGVSTIVPIVFSLAGKNKTVSPSVALTTVSSVSFLGFLLGPPFIGYIAALTSLRVSFACIGIFGFCISFLVARMSAVE